MTGGFAHRLLAPIARLRFVVALALGFLALVALTAILAPVIANDRPIVGSRDGHLSLPILHAGQAPSGGWSWAIWPPLRHAPNAVSLPNRLQPPEDGHLLGTDDLGRDVLARLVYGSRISLLVGLMASLISLVVGSLVGAIAGYWGGAADWIVSRVIEVVLCFPFFFLLLAIIALVEPSVWTIILAIGLTSWTGEARFVRGEFLRIRELDFAQAARATGARSGRIVLRHLMPNAIGPAIVSASFGVASAILGESALSFLGFGVPLPQASWGSVLASATNYMEQAWWLAVFPGLAIFLTVLSVHVVGERLRESLDPTVSSARYEV